jgi:hypothetical protein
MGGIATYKFPRSISLTILRAAPSDPMTEDVHDPRCLTQIMVRRAICIWQRIVKYQNRTGDSIQLSALDLPEEAYLPGAKSRERSGGRQREQEESKGTYESVSATPSESEGTPSKL